MNKMYIITPIIGIEMNSFFIPFSIHISIISFIVCFIYDFMPFLLKKNCHLLVQPHDKHCFKRYRHLSFHIYIMYSLHPSYMITQSFILSINDILKVVRAYFPTVFIIYKYMILYLINGGLLKKMIC